MEKLNAVDQEQLRKLREWNIAYRTDESPVSDKDYDAEKADFASKHPNHPFVIKNEPNPVPENRKEHLPIEMKSLDKIKNLVDLGKWFKKNGVKESDVIGLGPKWDGLSLLDHLAHVKAWTRGGEDNDGMRSDQHLFLIDREPKYYGGLEYTGGEVLISRKNFEEHWKGKINPRTGEPYKTARGVMSGLMRNDKPSEMLKYVDYVRYYSPELEHLPFDEYVNRINELNNVKHPQHFVKVSEITDELMNQLYEMWNADYEIDGIVIMINDPVRRAELGRHARSGNPKYAVAYKGDFEERLETVVKSVTCRVSKQGFLKPTVQLDTVVLSGAEVNNPTGYNMKWIFDNNVAKDSVVVVKRSGEVIPKITKVLDYNSAEVEALADELVLCPACEGFTQWNKSYVELVCTNPDCCGKRLAEIVAFFEIMKFEDFGEGTIEKLFDEGYDSVYKILQMCAGEFIAIDGLGESTAENFAGQCLNKLLKEGVSLATVMHSSSKFTGLGSTKLQLILDNIDESIIRDMIDSPDYLPVQDILKLDRVSGLAEKSIELFIAGWPSFLKWYLEIYEDIKISNVKTVAQEVTGATCEGMAVCFSGFRDDNLESFIKGEGGEIKKSYSKKVTHLIVVDPNGTSSKITKAKKDGCQVLTAEQFKSL